MTPARVSPGASRRRAGRSRLLAAAMLAVLAGGRLAAQGKRAITIDDALAVRGIADPQLSPDGRFVLYAVRQVNFDANRRAVTTFVQPVAGGDARAFPDDSMRASEARWAPDGGRVAYVAGGQLWVARADGTDRRKLTELTGGASGPVWSPQGDRVAFTSGVYPECRDEACNAALAEKAEKSKVKAHIADQLMFRHWDRWDDGTRSHLFVVGATGSGLADLTLGAKFDVPPGPFGGSEGYAWSPDGREMAYTAKLATRDAAWTTDVNLYVVNSGGGAPELITGANKGADQNPVYSPDGRWIVYQSQRRARFESDRWRLMQFDRQSKRSLELLPGWDRNADAYRFAGTGALLMQTVDRGRGVLLRVPLQANEMRVAPVPLRLSHNNHDATVSSNGLVMAWVHDAVESPAEVWVGRLENGAVLDARPLTHLNDALVAQLDLHPAEDFWFRGAGGDSVQGFLVKPPGWRADRKSPAILLIHGGPQGAWLDSWHGRWNYQLFAATGAAMIIINPRGSTGYGQRFVDGVSKDWGGKVYTDLMKGLDAAIARNAWIDTARLGATGGSYGGYMTNWIAGHSTRFKALATHAGVFNLEAMYGATEELWFGDWEFGGGWWDPTAMREQYRKWSPHLSAGKFTTPMLVIHGEKDFRVPIGEGLSLYTTLQRRNVPSRLVIFPDEGHWIGKPQNQRLWWTEMQTWFKHYLAPDRPLP